MLLLLLRNLHEYVKSRCSCLKFCNRTVECSPCVCFFMCVWSKLRDIPRLIAKYLSAMCADYLLQTIDAISARKENSSTFLPSMRKNSFQFPGIAVEGSTRLLTPFPLLPLVSAFTLFGRYSSQTTSTLLYGWRNGVKFTKFIFIHIQCCYCYSRIYLFTFSNRVCVQKIYLFAFNGVFLFRDYVFSHLGHVFIHIQRVIFVHIHDSKYSFSIFCAASLRIIRS